MEGTGRLQVALLPALALDGERALPEPVAPARVRVAEAVHVEAQHGLELEAALRAAMRRDIECRALDPARAGVEGEVLAQRLEVHEAGCAGIRDGLGIRRDRNAHAVGVPALPGRALEVAHQEGLALEVDRGPEPGDLRRLARAAGRRRTDGSHAPGAIARGEGPRGVDPRLDAARADPALPGAELREAGHVDQVPRGRARLHACARLLERGRAR